LLEKKS